MGKQVPTYLYKRGSLYYFQMRDPTNNKKLIRKSTKTGNYREALQIARHWWVNMNQKTKQDIDQHREDLLDKQDLLYHRGKELYEQLATLDPQDSIQIQEAIIQLFGKGHYSENFDREALYFYQDRKADTLEYLEPKKKRAQKRYRLSELLDKYVEFNMNEEKPWSEGTKKKYVYLIQIMIEMLNNPYADDLTPDILSEKYTYKVKDIPRNIVNHKNLFYRKNKRLPIDKIIEIAKNNNIEKISLNSVKDYKQRAKHFITWLVNRDHADKSLLLVFEKLKKAKKEDGIDVRPFSTEELKAIFLCKDFQKGLWLYKKSFRHWIPLIGLYSGMRLGEICQLYTKDIKQDEETGIWYFDIYAEGDNRRLKTSNSNRLVPVHKDLITLGLINYRNHLKTKKEQQLFPDITHNDSGKWTKNAAYWFNTKLLEQCGIKRVPGQRKSFHSLRHTLLNYEKQNHLNASIFHEIVGHKKSSVHGNYQQEYTLKTKAETLNQVDWDLDLSLIKKFQ